MHCETCHDYDMRSGALSSCSYKQDMLAELPSRGNTARCNNGQERFWKDDRPACQTIIDMERVNCPSQTQGVVSKHAMMTIILHIDFHCSQQVQHDSISASAQEVTISSINRSPDDNTLHMRCLHKPR